MAQIVKALFIRVSVPGKCSINTLKERMVVKGVNGPVAIHGRSKILLLSTTSKTIAEVVIPAP